MLWGASAEMLVFESLLQQRYMHVAHQLVTACLAGGFVVELCEWMARRMGVAGTAHSFGFDAHFCGLAAFSTPLLNKTTRVILAAGEAKFL